MFFCRLDATNVGIISDPDRKLSDSIGKGGCSFMYNIFSMSSIQCLALPSYYTVAANILLLEKRMTDFIYVHPLHGKTTSVIL